MSEAQITKKIAEIILGVVNNPKYPDLKYTVCFLKCPYYNAIAEYHDQQSPS